MADTTTTWLREAATPELYRRNAFRITGVPTDADRRAVRQRRQRVTTLLAVGADADVDGEFEGVDPQDVGRAFDLILGDPRRRLIDELFWLWETPDATCPCPSSLHRDHDAAVCAHSLALDRERDAEDLTGAERRELDGLWDDAAAQWGRQLRRVAFWDHVRHRITALDDKQLDESTLDLIRSDLPTALTRPVVALAGEAGPARQATLSGLARAWPAPPETVTGLLEQAAEPAYTAVRDAVRTVHERVEDDPLQEVVAALRRDALPLLDRLDRLVPADLHQRTARTRNSVAVAFNDCAVALIEDTRPMVDPTAGDWLETARTLASDPVTVERVTGNAALFTRLRQAYRAAPLGPPTPEPVVTRARVDQEFVGCLVLTLIAFGLLIWCLTGRFA